LLGRRHHQLLCAHGSLTGNIHHGRKAPFGLREGGGEGGKMALFLLEGGLDGEEKDCRELLPRKGRGERKKGMGVAFLSLKGGEAMSCHAEN